MTKRLRTAADGPADEELVRQAVGGDERAFEQLYDRHYRRVYALCLKMCHNAAEAEDLAQDAFLQMHRKLSSFRGESAFTTWLHRLTVNLVIMHFRSQQRRFALQPLADDDGQPCDLGEMLPHGVSVMFGEHVPDAELRAILDEAVGELAPGYREAFRLHAGVGLGHKEIAEMLDCAEGTSKSQFFKARLHLRRVLTATA